MILDPFAHRVGHIGASVGARYPRPRHLDVDVAAALVEFADRGHVGVQRLRVEAARFCDETEHVLRLCFHHFLKLLGGQRRVTLERHRVNLHLRPLHHGESDTRRPKLLVDIQLGPHLHLGESLPRVIIDDLLPVRLDRRLAEGVPGLGTNFLANPCRLELGDSVELHLRQLRLGLDHHDDAHPVRLAFAKNPHVVHVARGVEISDIVLDHSLVVRPTHTGTHVGQDLFIGDRAGADELHLDGFDQRCWRLLRLGGPGSEDTEEKGSKSRQ